MNTSFLLILFIAQVYLLSQDYLQQLYFYPLDPYFRYLDITEEIYLTLVRTIMVNSQ